MTTMRDPSKARSPLLSTLPRLLGAADMAWIDGDKQRAVAAINAIMAHLDTHLTIPGETRGRRRKPPNVPADTTLPRQPAHLVRQLRLDTSTNDLMSRATPAGGAVVSRPAG